MEQDDVYYVDVIVPKAVLLDDHTPAPEIVHPNECDAVWYQANASSVICDENDIVQAWRPEENLGVTATPAKPNTGTLRLAATGGMTFVSEINSGLVVQNALSDPKQFSLAIRYSSALGEARSLLTVNPSECDTYLFLAEKEGHVIWQDQQDHATLSLPAPKGGGWILAGFDEGMLSLTTAPDSGNIGPVHQTKTRAENLRAAFDGACDLFIGCRSHRKGILKTLGTSQVHDVLLWIDQDWTKGDPAKLAAALRYCENQGTPL